MICQKYADYVAAYPCPEDTLDKKYRLGLLLPVDSNDFELAWIANGSRGKSVATFLQYYDQTRINARKTLVESNMASQHFDHSIVLAVRGDFLTDNSPQNACINHMMDGNLNYTMSGPIAVISEHGHGLLGSVQHFQPCDFRILIDFLFNYGGKPKIEVGHACGDDSKGTSVSRFLNRFKEKVQNVKKNPTDAVFDVENHMTYRLPERPLAGPDRLMDSGPYLSRPTAQHTKSSINLGSFKDDESSLHKPEAFVMPDFLPDWIRESESIFVGPSIPRPQTAPDLFNDKDMTIKKSPSIDSMAITPITKGRANVYQNENISVKGSIDIFDLYNPHRPKTSFDAMSIISTKPSPSVITTTSFFHSNSLASKGKNYTESTVYTKSSFFSRPKSNSNEIDRDVNVIERSVRGSLMSPWMV